MPPPKREVGVTVAGVSEGNFDTRKPRMALASIADSFAHTGAYTIRLPGGPLMPAVDAFHFSGLPLGARPIGQYAPRSRVLIYFDPSLQYVIILGAVPRGASSAKLVVPGAMTLRSTVGVTEPRHYTAFTVSNTLLPNHSAGRPVDTLPGDWGAITDLGLAIYLGRTMGALKASELAKLEAFWGDDLVRLTAYNYEKFTASRHNYAYNDEGEYNEVERMSPYPWEGAGSSSPTAIFKSVEGKLAPGMEDAPFEPQEVDQLIMPRHIKMKGYLGDVEKEWVVKPPSELKVERYSSGSIYAGLLEITKSLNGAYHIRSAKEITFEKYSLIPIPKELIAPEDPVGDQRTNYDAADLNSTYEIPEYVWGEEDPNIRSAQLWEYHAYLFSRYTPASILAHTKDWFMPEELDLVELNAPAIFKDIAIGHAFMADLPAYGELTIDHRAGNSVRYYRSRSIIKQLDDGSIIVEDGYGSSLTLKGGSIFLDCVGDVWAKPGRSFVVMAPHDAVLKAGNAVDISSSLSDVRIKAEKNLHMLSGNAGVGGLLLENRASGFSRPADFSELGAGVHGHGITLKAVNSSLYGFAEDVHIGRRQSTTGIMTLDAGTTGTMYIRGKNIHNRNLGIFTVVRDTQDGSSKQVFSLDLNTAILSTTVQIGGSVVMAPANGQSSVQLFLGGDIICHGQGVFNKSVLTNQMFAAKGSTGLVGSFKDEIDLGNSSADLGKRIDEQRDIIAENVNLINQVVVNSSDTSPGNERFQDRMGFSHRTTADTGLNSTFILYESRWQQLLRISGTKTKWNEPDVEAPSGEVTLPYPGREAWESFDSFGQINTDNFNYEYGLNNGRVVQQFEGQAPVKGSLGDGYLINVQGVTS